MMEIREEALERCHTKILNTENSRIVDRDVCGYPAKPRKTNGLTTNNASAISCAHIMMGAVSADVPDQMQMPSSSTISCGENIDAVDTTIAEDLQDIEPNGVGPVQEGDCEANIDVDDDDDVLDNSDESTSDSDFSDLSDMSEESGREWKPVTKPINWVQKQFHSGANPRELLSQMLPNSGNISSSLNDMTLWRILASMLSEPPRRQKLRHINTFSDVIRLVREAKNIIVLTGAGVSVSCGIPDFRSSDGIYSRLAIDFPDLPDPQAMFDINYFSRDPRPFYKFAREIYPGQFTPSPCHRFIKLLETKKKLLRNYTQNIDTLEQVAGIQNIIECHGSFSTASCTKCKFKTNADAIREDIFAQRIPVCPRCQLNVRQSVDASQPVSEFELKQIVENGIMKPDIVFFGEGLSEKFHTVMANDKDKCDLLIVMGSSLKVRPVALIPSSIPAHVPQILINREQLHHLEFDVELLGDSDVIINQLCHHLGDEWKDICFDEKILQQSSDLMAMEDVTIEEEDAQQFRHDTDTQSVKSNSSTDIALRSAGGYSDSGFESSTSSGVVGKATAVGINSDTDSEATEIPQQEKAGGILHMKNAIIDSKENNATSIATATTTITTTATNVNVDTNTNTNIPTTTITTTTLSSELLDDNMDAAVGFENPTFRPFIPTSCADTYRHLSIDSSKDSGIQCSESSNSASGTPTSGVVIMTPSTDFNDSGGTNDNGNDSTDTSATMASPAQYLQATEPAAIPSHTNNNGTSNSSSNSNSNSNSNNNNTTTVSIVNGGCHAEHKLKRRQEKRLSVGDRLLDGTYYCHEGSSSYVFPGAQVSWYTEMDEDEEDEEDEENEEDFDDDDDDIIDATEAISPLLPPSIEAEMVTEMTTNCEAMSASSAMPDDSDSTTSTFVSTCIQKKAFFSQKEKGQSNNETIAILQSSSSSFVCGPPPVKKRRDSYASKHDDEETLTTATVIARNAATPTSSQVADLCDRASMAKETAATNEVTLQTALN